MTNKSSSKDCGGFTMQVSQHENYRGWMKCSFCGKIIKTRPNKDSNIYIPKHKSRQA